MRRYAVSWLVTMALAVGCDEAGTPHDTPRDVYGRPLVGADGPLRYRTPGPDGVQGQALRSSIAGTQFSLGAYTSHSVGSWPEAVAIGDVTCDGRPDVVMTTLNDVDAANDYRVFVFPQLADGGLGKPVSYPYGANAARNGIALADLNKDGCLDVVVGQGPGLSVLLADKATGGLETAVVVTDGDANTLSAMDVNRDGQLDIISLGWSRGASLFYGDGTGAFPRIVPFATKAAGYNDHEVGDLNGDGIPDLAVMSGQSYSVPNLSVHLHDGINALSTSPRSYFMGQNMLTGGLGLGDVNGDGRVDAVLSKSNNSPTVLWIMLQDAKGDLVGPTTIASYQIPGSLEIADLDRDGDDDVVVVHDGWLKVGVYLQEAGALKPEVLYDIPYASNYAPQGLAIGDFSGDGCGDVAIADYNAGLVTLYGNCPSPCATATDGTACDDRNACTRTDTCQAGACVGESPVTCAALDSCHTVGVCDPASGACSNPSKPNGSGCDDGNACTRTDTCQTGACVGESPVTCAALDECHGAGVCDTATGMCTNPSMPDGTACGAGTCSAGVCVSPPDGGSDGGTSDGGMSDAGTGGGNPGGGGCGCGAAGAPSQGLAWFGLLLVLWHRALGASRSSLRVKARGEV